MLSDVLSRRVPLPAGPPPRLVGKNSDDLMLPTMLVAHLRVRYLHREETTWGDRETIPCVFVLCVLHM